MQTKLGMTYLVYDDVNNIYSISVEKPKKFIDLITAYLLLGTSVNEETATIRKRDIEEIKSKVPEDLYLKAWDIYENLFVRYESIKIL